MYPRYEFGCTPVMKWFVFFLYMSLLSGCQNFFPSWQYFTRKETTFTHNKPYLYKKTFTIFFPLSDEKRHNLLAILSNTAYYTISIHTSTVKKMNYIKDMLFESFSFSPASILFQQNNQSSYVVFSLYYVSLSSENQASKNQETLKAHASHNEALKTLGQARNYNFDLMTENL